MSKPTDNPEGVARLKAGMPSLSHLELSLRSKRELGKIIGVHRQPSGKARQIADGLVRLVEKSILEYEEARANLVEYMSDGTLDNLHRAQDHFESSIYALNRALAYVDRLRAFGYKRQDGSPLIPRPRDLEILRDSVRSPVREMRDALEHLDNDIVSNRLPEDSPVEVHLGWTQATLGSNRLTYTDVTRWLEQLHTFAALLSKVQLQVGPALPKG